MGKKLGIGVMLLVFLIVGVEIVYIFVLKEKELTKSEWVQNVEKLIEKTDIDVIDKEYEDTYTYTLENGKIDNLNCKGLNLKQTNGQIIYDKIGIGSYVIHNNKWCAKKTSFMEEMEVTDYEKDSCVLESNDEVEDNELEDKGSDKELEDKGSDKDSDKESENNKPVDDKEENNKPDENKGEDNKPNGDKEENTKPDENKGEDNKPVDDKEENDKPDENKGEDNNPNENEDNESKIIGCFEFDKETGTIEKYLVDNSDCSKDVVIPNEIDGVPVKMIGSFAFAHAQLTHVEIPSSVTSIDIGAFQDNQLTSVEIPDSVITVGHRAFFQNLLTSVKISSNLTSIEEGTFAFNLLTSVEIPASVKDIGNMAFAANQITNVTLSYGVTNIEMLAFVQNKITSIKIPASVTRMGTRVFQNNQLTSVIIEGKSSPSDFEIYEEEIWSWQEGYDDSNIIWNG